VVLSGSFAEQASPPPAAAANGYIRCLEATEEKTDDGRSTVIVIARAIEPTYVQQFAATIWTQGSTLVPAVYALFRKDMANDGPHYQRRCPQGSRFAGTAKGTAQEVDLWYAQAMASGIQLRYSSAMTITRDETIELRRLYDMFSLAVERASATMHMHGIDHPAFRVEDGKCVAIWGHIRELMEKMNEQGSTARAPEVTSTGPSPG
jgi:hypothetical protein